MTMGKGLERIREVGSWGGSSEEWEDRECFIGEQEGAVASKKALWLLWRHCGYCGDTVADLVDLSSTRS